MTIWVVPLESLEERYTGQWARWIPEMLRRAARPGEALHVIEGEVLTTSVQTGAFLDLYSSAHYKATQLAAIARLFSQGQVRAGDAFWFSDIEFPGMETVRYLAELSAIPVRVYGFLHAASYTQGDYMEPMAPLGKFTEAAWVRACDRVFVGSHHHRCVLSEARLTPMMIDPFKVVPTGNPWRPDEARALAATCAPPSPSWAARPYDVIYPHRPDAEKDPETFLRAAITLVEQRPYTRVLFTTGRAKYRSTNAQHVADAIVSLAQQKPDNFTVKVGLKREEFYALLASSKVVVSTTHEENYGYAMVEGMTMGCVPLAPDAFAHAEYIPRLCLFPAWRGDVMVKALVEGMLAVLQWDDAAVRRMQELVEKNVKRLAGAEDRIVAAIIANRQSEESWRLS